MSLLRRYQFLVFLSTRTAEKAASPWLHLITVLLSRAPTVPPNKAPVTWIISLESMLVLAVPVLASSTPKETLSDWPQRTLASGSHSRDTM